MMMMVDNEVDGGGQEKQTAINQSIKSRELSGNTRRNAGGTQRLPAFEPVRRHVGQMTGGRRILAAEEIERQDCFPDGCKCGRKHG